MKITRILFTRRVFLPACIGLALIVTTVFLFQPPTHAQRGLRVKTATRSEALPNYDIRTDKAAYAEIAVFRSNAGRTASEVADTRDSMVAGESALRSAKPGVKVEYNNDLRIPEVITPAPDLGRAELARSVGRGRVETLRDFLQGHKELVGAGAEQIVALKVSADYINPDGKLSFVELEQEIKGIRVFRGRVKAGFNARGDLFRIVNNFAPGLEYAAVSAEFGDPQVALDVAHENLAMPLLKIRGRGAAPRRTAANKVVFGRGDFATTAEKVYFPTEPGVVVPAWRVLIWQPVNAYYVIVDASTRTVLWRKNITEDQTQPVTYNVYANPGAAATDVADSPFPITPGPTSPTFVQGAPISRTLLTMIGNESGNAFNNLGWIPDGANDTNGNNVEAGLDRDAMNGVDGTNGRVVGNAFRTFDFPINPSNPNTNTGDTPVPPGEPVASSPGDTTPGVCNEIAQPHGMIDAQRAGIVQLFYVVNRFHDVTYSLGFNEAAGNFQDNNFGRGGLGSDRVSAEAQDCSGVNNANFATPADGARGRMQMYLFTAPTPDVDGGLDADVVIHEAAHGLSNRLHGDADGLNLDVARGMGEGWSDFFAHCMLSEPTDPINGIYSIGAYVTYSPGFSNAYYGIRRFPKAVMSFTGGSMNRPHNPLTFQDIDSTKINISDGAFAPAFTGTADQVHNIGEVWSSALWEIRARMIQNSDWATGNTKVMQYVIDGMKLAPLNPTPISERDAMLAAVIASGSAQDVADTWAGFAIRGFGVDASIQHIGGSSTGGKATVRVTESFATPNLLQSPAISVSDATGNNNGFIDPGEPIQLTIPLSNATGLNATSATLQISGGGSANYGDIGHQAVASRVFSYVVPANTACGSLLTLTLNVNSSLGPTTITRSFAIGAPVNTLTQNFDGVTPPSIPSGWAVTSTLPAMAFVTTNASSDTAPNSIFATDPTVTGGSTELTSPIIPLTAAASTLSFRHRYNTEPGWDGGVLEISVAGGAFQDIAAAGATVLQNGYNGFMGESTGNPIGGKAAWTGDSAAYVTTVVRMPATAVGQNIQLRWRFVADNNTAPAGGGWNVDTIQFAGSFTCAAVSTAAGVEISGRVLTPDGRGIRGVQVHITDAGGATVTTSTGRGGQYRFTDVEAGRTYVIRVASRRFRFDPVVIEVNDSISGLDLIAAPNWCADSFVYFLAVPGATER